MKIHYFLMAMAWLILGIGSIIIPHPWWVGVFTLLAGFGAHAGLSEAAKE